MSYLVFIKSGVVTPATTVVQSKTNGGDTITSLAATFSSNVTAGNLLIAAVGCYNTSYPLLSVKDNLNTPSWTLAGTAQQGSNNTNAAIFYYKNTLAGACTVTLTIAGSSFRVSIGMLEVSGLTGTVDVTSKNTGSTNTGTDPGSLTPTVNNELLVANMVLNGTCTAGAVGWTFTGITAGSSTEGFQYRIAPSSGTPYDPAFTLSSSVGWAATAAAFK